MKKPEEIKKGLECCRGINAPCEGCPYNMETMDYDESVSMLHEDALAYIQQLEAQVPRWISVEERLPDAKLAVLGYGLRSAAYEKLDPFEAEHVVYTRGEDEGWFTFWNNEHVDVTHWMPLPEPPEEDAQ